MSQTLIISSHSQEPPLHKMGGKAKNLHFLSSRNLPVPRWFCLSADAFELFFLPYKEKVSALVAQINFEDFHSIKAKAQEIHTIFMTGTFPQILRKEIDEAFAANLQNCLSVSVRSSALSEDSGKDSFAGQMDTFLFVNRADLETQIRACWASAFGERVLTYTHARNIDPVANRVAVVIQEMFESEVSGVLFTANPTGILHEMLIVGGYGIGEGIVSDQVETDTFVYQRFDKSIDKTINLKEWKLERDASGGTRKSPVTNGSGPCLTDAQIHFLAEQSIAIEKLYGEPQDIEWGINAQGALAFLQARPITTLPDGEKVLFDNSNISESYPGITLPLTFSFIRVAYEGTFRPATARCGASSANVTAHSAHFKNLVSLLNGRVYYNLSNWYAMFRIVPGMGKYVEVWEEMMGIADPIAAEPKQSLKNHLKKAGEYSRVGFRLLVNYFTVLSEMSRLHDNFEAESRAFKKLRLKELSPQAIMRTFFSMREKVFAGWEVTLINDMFTFIFSALTRALLKKAGFENPNDIFNRLLLGEAQMDSIKPVRSILELCQIVRQSPSMLLELQTLSKVEGGEFGSRLALFLEAERPFDQAFANHIEVYGDRSHGELKLETLTFRENPKALIEQILTYVDQTELSAAAMLDKDQNARHNAETELKSKLSKNPLLKILFNWSLKRTKTFIMYRENSRLDRSRVYGIVRSLFRELGRKLVLEKSLDSVEDIFYLSEEEVATWVEGSSVNPELKSLVKLRKEQYQGYEKLGAMDRILIQGNVYQRKVFAREEALSGKGDDVLTGTACSAGIIEAEACIVLDAAEAPKVAGKILIAEMTDPGWVFLMLTAGGLISEKGSILSHTAIIGRELGIPTIVGVKGATRRIPQGSTIQMNGESGEIKIVALPQDLKSSAS